MCYSPSPQLFKVEYICPKCGDKTLYDVNTAENKEEMSQIVRLVRLDIRNSHLILKQIKGLDITLDESQFCKKCLPDVKSPRLVMTINYGGDKKHRVEGVTTIDLKLIKKYLEIADKQKNQKESKRF
jgi:hypothetical protein